MTPALVSVIIPARNAAHTLPDQLEALAAQEYGGAWEVLIVDNDSSDETVRVARRWLGRLPALRILRATDGRGANHARNAGMRPAAGDLLAFCDADDVVAPGWLSALARAACTADLIGGRLEFERLNTSLARSCFAPTPTDGPRVQLGFLPFVGSGNLAVRADATRVLGGFNEHYRAHEDTEFCWRAQLAGYRLAFAPDAVVHCRFREGLWPLARQHYLYGRAEPQLYRDFRGAGMRRSGCAEVTRTWGYLTVHAVDRLATRAGRRWWLRQVALRCGRITGSVRSRVLFL
jgi:glycosyltransferase involved in cell wall biosynthesis